MMTEKSFSHMQFYDPEVHVILCKQMLLALKKQSLVSPSEREEAIPEGLFHSLRVLIFVNNFFKYLSFINIGCPSLPSDLLWE